MIRVIDQALLDRVTAAAASLPRQRKNHNFHPADDFPCHRMINAIEPGSYVRPHRHLDTCKDETMVCLRGRFGVVVFDAGGGVVHTLVMAPGSDTLGVDIPHGVYHTLVALEPGSAILEAKAGPYQPLADSEMAPWAPAEGSAAAVPYLDGLRRFFP